MHGHSQKQRPAAVLDRPCLAAAQPHQRVEGEIARLGGGRSAGDHADMGTTQVGMFLAEPQDFIWQVRMYQETVTMIDNLVPVTIAAVDGVCTGGGLELRSRSTSSTREPTSTWRTA
jgi:hypothetical protein